MNLLTEYSLPAILIIGFMVVDYRTRHLRPFVLKQALFVNFIAACFCAGPNMRAGWRPALTIFLFIFVITSLGAVGRWFEQRRYFVMTQSQTPSQQEQS